MRILYVNHTGLFGGAERSLLDLINGLKTHGVEPVVACPLHGPLHRELQRYDIRAISVPEITGSLRLHPVWTPSAFVELASASLHVAHHAYALEADIIHGNSIRASLIAGVAGRLSRRPSVAHLRDRLPDGKLTAATMAAVYMLSSRIVANSHHTASAVTGGRLRQFADVIYNPVDIGAMHAARNDDPERLRNELGIQPDRFCLGVVGQISPVKGQDIAVKATRQLRRRGTSCHLVIAGEVKFTARAARYDNSRYSRELYTYVDASDLRSDVVFLGERSDIPQVMAGVDLLLVPSREEGFGRVVVEAMAAGTPVVAAARGGPAEIITNGVTGLLVASEDPNAWADAIETVMSDTSVCQQLVNEGRKYSERFGLAQHADAMLGLYRSLL